MALGDDGADSPYFIDMLRMIFESCDVNHDGSISKIEFVKALRTHPAVAEFFNLPSVINEGGKEKLEQVFQKMDRDRSKTISWEEFQSCYCQQMSKSSSRPTSPSDKRGLGLEASFYGDAAMPLPDGGCPALERYSWLSGMIFCVA